MSTQWAHWRAERRQRRHHAAFRIDAPIWDERQRAQLERLVAGIGALAPEASPPAHTVTPASPEPAQSALDENALAEAGTRLWSAQRKLAQEPNDGSKYARQAGRYLGFCRDELGKSGLIIQDHDGSAYNPDRDIEVLAFEDDPSLDRERILHTVRPTVYLFGRQIQRSQVVVGRPPAPKAAPHTATRRGTL